MKFGFSKYVNLDDMNITYPLPNGYSDTYIQEKIEVHNYNTLSRYNPYKFLFKKEMDYCDFGFGAFHVDDLIKNREVFVYPIFIKSLFDIHRLKDEQFFLIDNKIIEQVRLKKCKIVLFYLLEGDFFDVKDFNGINLFVEKYKFNNDDVLFVNNNNILDEVIIKNGIQHKFLVVTYNYFMTNLWFSDIDITDSNSDKVLQSDFNRKISYVTTYPKEKKFLILNRRPRPHRVVLFTEIMKNNELRDNCVISIGGCDLQDDKMLENDWVDVYNRMVDSNYKHSKNEGIEFLTKYDNTKNCFVDSNPNFNLAFNINDTLQLNTFVSVVTETLFENDTVFFSEKIFKPIFTCQPFIILGNPHMLRELKKLGFETFEEYWDESYDLETDFTKRTEKVIDTIKSINKKSNEELFEMTKKMSNKLKHNYFNLTNKSKEEIFTLKKTLNEQFH